MFRNLILLICLFPFHSFSQTERTSISGKTYYIYPFRSEEYLTNYYHDPNEIVNYLPDGTMEFNGYLFPCIPTPSPDSLPDGDYIQYYHDRNDSLAKYSDVIAAKFRMQNNLLEGKYLLFSVRKDTLQIGNFHEGKPAGIWDMRQIPNPSVGWYSLYRVVTTYVDGNETGERKECTLYPTGSNMTIKSGRNRSQLHGLYESTSDGKLLSKGSYQNGEKTGEWVEYEYVPNADTSDYVLRLKRHYKIPETWQRARGVIIRDRFYESDNDTMAHGFYSLKDNDLSKNPIVFPSRYWEQGISFDCFYWIPQKDTEFVATVGSQKSFEESMGSRYQKWVVMSDRITVNKGMTWRHLSRPQAIDTFGYVLHYELFEEYYPNGQLMLRLEAKNGKLIREDTIFWDNGLPCNVVNYLPDSKQYEEKLFNKEGQLVKRDLFDEKGNLVQTTVDKTGLFPTHVFVKERTYEWDERSKTYNYQAPTDELNSREKILLSEQLSPTDSAVVERVEFDPSKSLLTKDVYSDQIKIHMEATISANGKRYSGTFVATSGDFQRTDSLMDFGDFFSYLPLNDRLNQIARAVGPNYHPNVTYKGKPFKGKVEYKFTDDPSKSGTAKKGVFVLRKDDPNALSNFYCLFGGPLNLTMVPMQNYIYGTALIPNGYEAPHQVERLTGNFKNGKRDGKWQSYFDTGEKAIQAHFKQNILEGDAESYSYAYPQNSAYAYYQFNLDTFPQKTSYYLNALATYTADASQTYTMYDWTGAITSIQNAKKQTSLFTRNSVTTKSQVIGDSTFTEIRHAKGSRKDYILRSYKNIVYAPAPIAEELPESDTLEMDTPEGGEVVASVPTTFSAETDDDWFTLPNSIEKIYYEPGKLFQIKKADSLGHIVFQENYAPNGDLLERFTRSNGVVTTYERWENGVIKRRFEFREKDNVRTNFIKQFRPAEAKTGDYLLNPRPATYPTPIADTFEIVVSNFHPNGQLKSTGKMKDLEQMGEWKVFDETGQPVIHFEFAPDTLVFDPMNKQLVPRTRKEDSTVLLYPVIGKRILLNSTDATVREQWILEQEQNYNCTQDEYFATRIYFTPGWNGLMTYRSDDGIKQAEGKLVDGLPEGFWQFFNPDGTIKEAGIYVKGKRHGRWLKGDLSKINYLGDLCIPDENAQKRMEELKNTIDFTVENYNMGTVLDRQYFHARLGR